MEVYLESWNISANMRYDRGLTNHQWEGQKAFAQVQYIQQFKGQQSTCTSHWDCH